MKILYATSEAVPFCKTGGLADVAGSLPPALAAEGAEIAVVLPLYRRIKERFGDQLYFECYDYVDLAWRHSYCGLFSLQKDGVTWYFLDNEQYFDRSELYGYMDDGERFAFFSRAVVRMLGHLKFWPEVIHCNDWQTALVPIYLLEEQERVWQLRGSKSVFTIHNIEYQGRYGDQVLEDLLGLNRGYMNEHMLAYHGDVNLMKGAIYAADYVTTVSPTYAEELQYPFYAHGLEGVVADNRWKLQGILNGLDADLYDPSNGAGLAAAFTPDDLGGKAACKAALQRAVGLREDPNVPIIACVSRLVRHKGFELVASAIPEIMNMDVQMVVLGTGEWNFEEAFRHAEAQYPSRFSARIQYSAALSTAIYGGADLFLMPSVSEPCGLSQMIAMRYGTVPVVRETGGLKDTVVPHGVFGDNGFTFADINAHDMVWVLGEAVDLYYNDKSAWRGLQHNGMTRDFSWNEPAREYEGVYYQITGIPRSEAEFHAPAGAPAPTEVPIPDEAPVAEEHPAPALAEEPVPEVSAAPAEEPPAAPVKRPAVRKAATRKSASSGGAKKASSGAGTAGTKKPAARKKKETPAD